MAPTMRSIADDFEIYRIGIYYWATNVAVDNNMVDKKIFLCKSILKRGVYFEVRPKKVWSPLLYGV